MSTETRNVALVTGGAGFIGSRLVRALLARGAQVVVYDNFATGRRSLLPDQPGVMVIEGDVRDTALLRNIILQCRPTAVCHLAALHFIPYCDRHPAETRQVNVDGTCALLTACRGHRLDVMLLASSGAVYPVDAGRFAEEHAPRPVDVYGKTKLAAEHLITAYARDTGTPAIIARLFNTFGAHETNPHVIPEIAAQLIRGTELRLGNLEPVRDYLYVDDLVAGLMVLLAGARALAPVGIPGVFNVGSGEGRSVLAIVRAFERAFGRQVRLARDERRVRTLDRPELVADVSKLKATGWLPRISFEEGIRRLVAASPAAAPRGSPGRPC